MPDRDAQTPTPDELIGPGIDKLVELRPRALRHINIGKGGYAKVFAGWRAQAALLCRRLADYAVNGRLRSASGEPLRVLTGSEFDTVAETGATKAVGQVTLTRTGAMPGGPIKIGSRFARAADATANGLWQEAQYEAVADVPVAHGQVAVTVPLIASRAGRFANRVADGSAQTEIVIADEIVDRTSWTVTSYEMAGGSDGIQDSSIQRYASAFAIGQYGPNTKAAIAGAMKAGARRVLAVDDPTVAALKLYVADDSWASSTRWCSVIRQFIRDNKFNGFGCKVLVEQLGNQIITIEATVRTRSADALADTTPLDKAIRETLQTYFDERPDFNRWSLAALRGVIARADRRLLSCSSVAVKTLDGAVVPEPTASSTTHYMLLANGVSVTYLNPV